MRVLALVLLLAACSSAPDPRPTSVPSATPAASETALPVIDAPSDPANPLHWYARALERRAAGDSEGAVDALEKARERAPEDPDLALELARAYVAARQYGAAAVAYAEASAIAPERGDLALARARFHLDHAFRVRDGLEAAERAARLLPSSDEARKVLDRARAASALAGR